jgi:hypothetical protein
MLMIEAAHTPVMQTHGPLIDRAWVPDEAVPRKLRGAILKKKQVATTIRYMYARSSRSAFICLRCQSRLLRKGTNRPLTLTAPRSAFSSVHRRSTPEEGTVESTPIRYTTTEETNPIRFTFGKGHNLDEDVPSSFASERRLLGRVRGKRGGEVREGSAALSIDSLGERAEVIILRDAGFERKEEKEEEETLPEDPSPKNATLSQDAILKSIEDAKVELDQDAVNVQIDSLRPVHSVSLRGINAQLSKKEYDTLCEVLRKGFSVAQLRGYCEAKRAELAKDAEEKKKKAADQGSSIEKEITLTWSPWKVGITPINIRPVQRMVNAVNMRISEKNHGRENLIWHIVHTFWKADVAENADDAVGELEFRVKPHELNLFTAGGKSAP